MFNYFRALTLRPQSPQIDMESMRAPEVAGGYKTWKTNVHKRKLPAKRDATPVIQNQLASSDGNGRVHNKRETIVDCFWRIHVLKIVDNGGRWKKKEVGLTKDSCRLDRALIAVEMAWVIRTFYTSTVLLVVVELFCPRGLIIAN